MQMAGVVTSFVHWIVPKLAKIMLNFIRGIANTEPFQMNEHISLYSPLPKSNKVITTNNLLYKDHNNNKI